MKTIRNGESRANLIDRLTKLTGEEKAGWGKMDVNQMMSHLVQAAELPFAPSLRDKSNFISRTFVKPLVLYVLPIPKGVKTSPEFDQQANGRKPQEFFADRQIVVDAVNTLGTLSIDHDCFHHPMFGKMSAKQWAVMAYKHIDHHLKQFGV